jgi:hypothetical protein
MEEEDAKLGQMKSVSNALGDFWNLSCCHRLCGGGEESGPGVIRSECWD